MANPERRQAFAKAGRARAIEQFSWSAIARQTVDLYKSLLK
jgi:starch synthase